MQFFFFLLCVTETPTTTSSAQKRGCFSMLTEAVQQNDHPYIHGYDIWFESAQVWQTSWVRCASSGTVPRMEKPELFRRRVPNTSKQVVKRLYSHRLGSKVEAGAAKQRHGGEDQVLPIRPCSVCLHTDCTQDLSTASSFSLSLSLSFCAAENQALLNGHRSFTHAAPRTPTWSTRTYSVEDEVRTDDPRGLFLTRDSRTLSHTHCSVLRRCSLSFISLSCRLVIFLSIFIFPFRK